MTPKEKSLHFIKLLYGPGEAARVSKLATGEPKDVRTGESWGTNIAFNKDYPPRILSLMGSGSIHFLQRLAKDTKLLKTVRRIIIVEKNPDTINHLVNHPKFTELLLNPQFRFILGADVSEYKAALFSILKQPDFSKIMRLCQVFIDQGAEPEIFKVYDECRHAYDEVVNHVFHNYGRIDDSLEGVKATLLNKDYIENNPGIDDLRNKFKGKPAAIIAAGPSLDYAIESGELKELHKRCVFIAADAAVKPLLKAGIEPEFTTSIERGNLYQIPFWKDLPPIKTELVFFPVVHPDVLSLYPGPKRVCYRNYSYYAYFQNAWPKGIIGCGGSTTHLAFKLAVYMGCSDIILVGKDNAYEKRESDGLYRSHCNNLGHEGWATYHEKDYFVKEKNHAPSFETTAFDGSSVLTNITYNQWAKELSEMINTLELSGKVYATNPKAVLINGVQLEQLSTLIRSLEPLDKPELVRPRPYYHRKWEHKYLAKSVRGWKRLASTIKKVIEDAIASNARESKYPSSFYQFLNHKFIDDDLFVSFIIQNCAVEWYELENKWNALGNSITEDHDKRMVNLKDKASLFEQVLTKLETVFQETANV